MILYQLNFSKSFEIADVEKVLSEGNDVQLFFISLDNFKDTFPKFSSVLYEYADQVKSIYAPTETSSSSAIFEDTVAILSQIEDSLEITIPHLVIDSRYFEDIKSLCDFYAGDLQDKSLEVDVALSTWENSANPVQVIAWIEHERLQGVGLSVFVHTNLPIEKYIKEYIASYYIHEWAYSTDTFNAEDNIKVIVYE